LPYGSTPTFELELKLATRTRRMGGENKLCDKKKISPNTQVSQNESEWT